MTPDPLRRFRRWLLEARKAGVALPEAMALATADAAGRPAVRYVLLKRADERGFVFYTNTRSRKGRELRENPRASLAFYWDRTGRQVRIDGRVALVTAAEADAYWRERPRPSQLASAASTQSAPLRSRSELMARFRRLERDCTGVSVLRPPEWTGYRLSPARIEFWTRREPRLHERELFVKSGQGWKRKLLQP